MLKTGSRSSFFTISPKFANASTPFLSAPLGGFPKHSSGCSDCVRAVELHADTFETTRKKLNGLLIDYGIPAKASRTLADGWLIEGDFLLAEISGTFDFVVGSPPYVRQELIPDVLMAEYR